MTATTRMASTLVRPIDLVLSKLDGVSRSGDQWMARCPAHKDRDPSLSVSKGDDERALLNCFKGCDTEDIVRALGLSMSDLFFSPNESPSSRREVARYTYRDEEGARLYDKVRTDENGKKGFFRNPPGAPSSLYGLERLKHVRDSLLSLSESEKDCEAVIRLGPEMISVSSGGATTWREEWSEKIAAAKPRLVVVLEHNDDAGRKFSARVARSLFERVSA